MDYQAMYQAAYETATKSMEANDLGLAEATLFDYLDQDDGSLEFLASVKIPLLHLLGRAYFQQAKWADAKRRLRDAFALSQAFPGTAPSYADDAEFEAVAGFVSREVGMDVQSQGA